MLSRLFEAILKLPPGLVLLIIFLVPAAEASMFLGFLFPGEIVIILGGVLANEKVLPLWSVIVVGSLGSILGDFIGYEVGRRYGTRLLAHVPHRIVKPEHIERGKELLRKKGGRAVFLGRFTVALRVLIPGMAGASGLPYRRFLPYNILGGICWATETAIVGFIVGRGYQAAQHRITQVSFVILAILVLIFAVEIIRRRQPRERPTRPRGLAAWLAARFQHDSPTGLGLTLAAIGVVVFGWIFGGVLEDVVEGGGSVLYDQRILNFFVQHRTAALTQLARGLAVLGSAPVTLALVSLAGALVWFRTKRWRPLVFAASALALGQLIRLLIAQMVGRDRPPVSLWLIHANGFAFPSAHATATTVGFGLLAYLAYRLTSHWWQRLLAISAAALITVAVGLSRVYLGVHWPTDVVGGWSLGMLWLSLVLGATYVWRRSPR